jgi:hypothetical protein
MLKKNKYKSFFNSSLYGLNNLHPIVIIDYNPDADVYSKDIGEYGMSPDDRVQAYKNFDRKSIFLSTDPGYKLINSEFKNEVGVNSFYFEDRDLSIPSISESLDIDERKFKISDVSIKLNNYPMYLENRTSDLFKNNNFINKFVKIFYAPSNLNSIKNKIHNSSNLDIFNPDSQEYINSYDAHIPVYTGIIRSVTYDSKSISFKAEDYAEKKFHKEVPIARMSNLSNCVVKEDYLKPIPFSYGEVNYAPVQKFTTDSLSSKVYLLSDDYPSITNTERPATGFGVNRMGDWIPYRTEPALFIHKGEYCFIPQNYEAIGGHYLTTGVDVSESNVYDQAVESGNYSDYGNLEQWYNPDGSIGSSNQNYPFIGWYNKNINTDDIIGTPLLNSTMNNEIQAWHVRHPSDIRLLNFAKVVNNTMGLTNNGHQFFHYIGSNENVYINNPQNAYTLTEPGEFPYQGVDANTCATIPDNNTNLQDHLNTHGHINVTDNTMSSIPIESELRDISTEILHQYALNDNNQQQWSLNFVNLPSWSQLKDVYNDYINPSGIESSNPILGLPNYYGSEYVDMYNEELQEFLPEYTSQIMHHNYVGYTNGTDALLIGQVDDFNYPDIEFPYDRSIIYRYDKKYNGSNQLISIGYHSDSFVTAQINNYNVSMNQHNNVYNNEFVNLKDIWSFDEHYNMEITGASIIPSDDNFNKINFSGTWNGINNRHGCLNEMSSGVNLGNDFSSANINVTGLPGCNIFSSEYSNNLAILIKEDMTITVGSNTFTLLKDTLMPVVNKAESLYQPAISLELGFPTFLNSDTFSTKIEYNYNDYNGDNSFTPIYTVGSDLYSAINSGFYEGNTGEYALDDTSPNPEDFYWRGLFLSCSYEPSNVEGVNERGCYTYSTYKMAVNYDLSSFDQYSGAQTAHTGAGATSHSENTIFPRLCIRSGSFNIEDSELLGDDNAFMVSQEYDDIFDLLGGGLTNTSIDWTPYTVCYTEGGCTSTMPGGTNFIHHVLYNQDYTGTDYSNFPYDGAEYTPHTEIINDYGAMNSSFNTLASQDSSSVSEAYGNNSLSNLYYGNANMNTVDGTAINTGDCLTYHHWWDTPNACNNLVTTVGLDLSARTSYDIRDHHGHRELNLQIQRSTLFQRLELTDFSSSKLYSSSKGRSAISDHEDVYYIQMNGTPTEDTYGATHFSMEHRIEEIMRIWLASIYTSTALIFSGTMLYQLMTGDYNFYNPDGELKLEWKDNPEAMQFYIDADVQNNSFTQDGIHNDPMFDIEIISSPLRVSNLTGQPLEKAFFTYKTGSIVSTGSNSWTPFNGGTGENTFDNIGTTTTSNLTDIQFDLDHLNKTGQFVDINGNSDGYQPEDTLITWTHQDYVVGSGNTQADDIFQEPIQIKFRDAISRVYIPGVGYRYIPTLFNFVTWLIGVQSSLVYNNFQSIVTAPSHVLKHLAISEIGIPKEFVEFEEVVEGDYSYKIAFSTNKLINSKKLLESIATNTQSFPIFRPSANKFIVSDILNEYTMDNVDLEIQSRDVSKITLTFTPPEDIKHRVQVKYNMDYHEDELKSETSYLDISSELVNYDNNFYSLSNPTDATLEFDAKYLRDKVSAERLRDFLCYNSCNQHAKMKIELPIQYITLEIGDIVSFDSIIDNLKILGEDYTKENIRNGQIIYPYFKVIKTRKKTDSVIIEIYQLHKLKSDARTYNEFSPNHQEEIDQAIYGCTNILANNYSNLATVEDGSCEFTPYCYFPQDGGGSIQISAEDCVALGGQVITQGDANSDGNINIVDIIRMIDHMIGGVQLSGLNYHQADLDHNGLVDIIDIIILFEYINWNNLGNNVYP